MSTFEQQFREAVQLFQSGRLEQAQSAGRRLLEQQPEHPGALLLLGEIAWQRGNNREAQNLFRRAVTVNPGDPQANYRLGNVLFATRQTDEAARHYHRALELKADFWQVLVNLGLLRRSEGRFQQAREHFEQALKFRPDLTGAFCYLLDLLLSLGELGAIRRLTPEIQATVRKCITSENERDFAALMYLSPLLSVSRQDYDALSQKMDRLLHKPGPPLLHATAHEGQKIRIGYVSPDFGDHPISHVMRRVFGQHDRSRFEIFAYSVSNRTGAADREYTEIIRKTCDSYVDLSMLTIRQAAERIAADNVSILVNLSGYMSPQCLEIFSLRPAPVQVYWLGHGGGLGLTFIDYVIADAVVIPPGDENHYREKVARLPEVYHCTDTPPIPELTASRRDYGLDEKAFVFCAFNNPNKINTEVFDTWMNILRRVPGSQLWLSNPGNEKALEQNLRAEAGQRGIEPERLVFATRLPDKSQHFARHRLADLFLDTFAYTAATTALDALWAGLPILTRPGGDFYSRICASFVSNVGLRDMICSSTQEYEDRAVYFAMNRAALAEVRGWLARNLYTEPMFNLPRFVRHLESAYMTMWQRHVSGEAAVSFNVSALPRVTA